MHRVLLAVLAATLVAAQPADRNLALGRPYTVFPAPNYALCHDEGDVLQLTDGEYVTGYFWTQKGTVGWQNSKPVIITIDLGQDQPIAGASFSTAAGRAGVDWPAALLLYVSDDNKSWHEAGDLVGLSASHGLPPATGYGNHRYVTHELKAHGRYLALVCQPSGPYFFCDEVEVYAGSPDLLTVPRPGEPVSDLKAAFTKKLVGLHVQSSVNAEVLRLRTLVQKANLPGGERPKLMAELARAEADNLASPPLLSATDRLVVPYSAGHRRVLQVQAALWRLEGRPPLQVWTTGRWDPLLPSSVGAADAPPATLAVTMMRREQRGAAFCMTNAGEADLAVKVQPQGFDGLPAGWLTVQEVAFTAAAGIGVAASALPDAERAGDAWVVHIPSGMTRQVWLTVDSQQLPAGVVDGRLQLAPSAGAALSVPLKLRVSSLTMPDRLSLSLGGWDYTDTFTYGVTPENRDRVVAFLKRYHVDTPWATGAVMPFGKHAPDGGMTVPPDTKNMDQWLERWQGARHYAVFNALPPLGEAPADRRRVVEWINFWVAHLQTKGVGPEQLTLLLHDEPHEPKLTALIVSYARIIREAQPKVVIFNDPTWSDPRQAAPELFELSTVLCPNRPMWLANRGVFEPFYKAQQAAGRQLVFYSCSGPVRSLDPYSYHRLQAWDCFRLGMGAMYFWALGDNGGGSAWNEIGARYNCYCPAFVAPDGVTTSKHTEAIREGLYDYEYLTMLRAKVAAGGAGAAAQRLVEEGPQQVLSAPGEDDIYWQPAKDREIADSVRVQVLDELDKLPR